MIPDIKSRVIQRLYEHFGIKKNYADFIYEFFIEELANALYDKKEVRIKNFGKFSYSYREKDRKVFGKFRPSDTFKCRVRGEDVEEYSKRKHRHMIDGNNEHTK